MHALPAGKYGALLQFLLDVFVAAQMQPYVKYRMCRDGMENSHSWMSASAHFSRENEAEEEFQSVLDSPW